MIMMLTYIHAYIPWGKYEFITEELKARIRKPKQLLLSHSSLITFKLLTLSIQRSFCLTYAQGILMFVFNTIFDILFSNNKIYEV
jgi:hypothetical protein